MKSFWLKHITMCAQMWIFKNAAVYMRTASFRNDKIFHHFVGYVQFILC